jgi:hypothetical protein
MKPFRNRPGTGRIQVRIRRAFTAAEPVIELTTRQLMEWTHALSLHRGKTSYRERCNHSRAIRRAAERLCERVGRRWPDGIVWRLRA